MPTAWNGRPPPTDCKVCSFRLPQVGDLQLPPTQPKERDGEDAEIGYVLCVLQEVLSLTYVRLTYVPEKERQC